MAVAAVSVVDMSRSSGKIGSFFRWLAAPITRLFWRKGGKKATRKGGAKSTAGAFSDDFVEEAVSLWTPERLKVIEKLWGEGCTSPSSAEFLQTSAPLLGLSEKKSLLMLGAGLGGVGRALVDGTGVWVTGLEADEELANLGKEMTKMTGMQKRAPVTLSNLEQAKLKENSFNAVVSLESLYRVSEKEQLYKAMIAALRVDGELLMTDFVIPSDDPPNEALADWLGQEASPPALWTPDKIHFVLSSLNVDLRPAEDITAKYRNRVFKGFFGYLSTVTKAELLEISDDLIAEVEYWAKTITAIDSGALKVFQFHAFKLPEKRKIVI